MPIVSTSSGTKLALNDLKKLILSVRNQKREFVDISSGGAYSSEKSGR